MPLFVRHDYDLQQQVGRGNLDVDFIDALVGRETARTVAGDRHLGQRIDPPRRLVCSEVDFAVAHEDAAALVGPVELQIKLARACTGCQELQHVRQFAGRQGKDHLPRLGIGGRFLPRLRIVTQVRGEQEPQEVRALLPLRDGHTNTPIAAVSPHPWQPVGRLPLALTGPVSRPAALRDCDGRNINRGQGADNARPRHRRWGRKAGSVPRARCPQPTRTSPGRARKQKPRTGCCPDARFSTLQRENERRASVASQRT